MLVPLRDIIYSAFPVMSANSRTEKPTTVIVADDSRMDCQLLVNAIEHQKQFEVQACPMNSEEAIASVRQYKPDVVVLSTRLQDGPRAGLLVLQTLRDLQLSSHAVLLLDEEEPALVVEAFRNGARGIFCRNGSSRELRKCIQSVREGKIWASKEHWEWIVSALSVSPAISTIAAPIAKILSKREEEIARLVASAMSNRELSKQLGLSEHTIKNHLSRIFEKLRVTTRTELVLYVLGQSKATGRMAPLAAHARDKRARGLSFSEAVS